MTEIVVVVIAAWLTGVISGICIDRVVDVKKYKRRLREANIRMGVLVGFIGVDRVVKLKKDMDYAVSVDMASNRKDTSVVVVMEKTNASRGANKTGKGGNGPLCRHCVRR
jgi:hypothetical protein